MLAVLAAALVLLPPVTATGDAGPPATGARADATPLVNPFVGTGGQAPWLSGDTTPAAARPFGMVQLGPDTTSDAASGSPSTTASGYAAGDDLVRGFSATHLSGAGCPAFGDVPVLPVVGKLPTDPASATVRFSHDHERAGPGWYRATLDNGVRVALAAADRSGLATYTFPAGARARLLIKAAGGLVGTERARVRFPSRREVAVVARARGFCGAPSSYDVHVLLRFDRAVTGRRSWSGDRPGAWVAFDTDDDPVVHVQVAVSFVDATGARRNLDTSSTGWSFTRLREAAGSAWDRELGRVRATGGSLTDRRLLDTALYHVLLNPMTVSDADRRYPGFDGLVHRVSPGRRQYTALPGWDAYRTTLPLLAWLRPDVASDVVRSLQHAADQSGWMPRWPLVASETGVMNGDSAAPMIAAAHAFGARDFDLSAAVSQLVRQGDVTDSPGRGWFEPRPGLDDYLRLGYVPNTTPERGWSQPHGASTTLEYAVDDFAVARLAAAAGRVGVARRYLGRSGSWRALVDSDRGLLLPRGADGELPGPGYQPGTCCDGFQEGNAVQYAWSVPQDMAGLVQALGSRQDLLTRLDDFHADLNAGAGSPRAWLGDQPSFETPWAYLWLGAPARSQDVVARARAELWSDTVDGLPGNDDLGSLSAWYVWASLGLYPLTPGTANVALGTPAFTNVTIRSAGGGSTSIERVGTGAHVQQVLVDGAPRTVSWVPFGPGARPRRLVVVTTDDPDPGWGTGLEDAPPSYPGG